MMIGLTLKRQTIGQNFKNKSLFWKNILALALLFFEVFIFPNKKKTKHNKPYDYEKGKEDVDLVFLPRFTEKSISKVFETKLVVLSNMMTQESPKINNFENSNLNIDFLI